MPPLLQSAQLKPDVSVTSAGPEDRNGESDDEGYISFLFPFFVVDILVFLLCLVILDKFHLLVTSM